MVANFQKRMKNAILGKQHNDNDFSLCSDFELLDFRSWI